jgi:hypothetical protein
MNIKTEIKKLVARSIFLNKSQKVRISEFLNNSTVERQKTLFQILATEKEEIVSIIKSFIAKKNPKGFNSLDLMIKNGQKIWKIASIKKRKKLHKDLEFINK